MVAVLTGADVDLAPIAPPMAPMINAAMARPWLATDKVRFVGEPVATVVAETRAQAVDAAELVVVDYEPLGAVVDLDTAADGPLLFDDAGTNVAFDMSEMLGFAPTDDFFAGCDVVVRQRIVKASAVPARGPRRGRLRWAPNGASPNGRRRRPPTRCRARSPGCWASNRPRCA